jgi:polar amino acid transport system substrate-binding protein
VRRILLPIALAVALGLTACSTSAGELPRSGQTATPTPTPSASASTPAPNCGDPEQSFNPLSPMPAPGQMPAGSFMEAIKKKGHLVAGVSADTLLLGSRNPINGQIEGFDIDMLHAVSKAIFNNPNRIVFRVITAAQRIPDLQDSSVDIVARAMTANCTRWAAINFSTIYYVAAQKVLVAKGSKANGLQDMAGKKVCAPKGTTTLDNLTKLYPKVVAVPVDLHTDCLALFQEGKVDGITGDDTILAGFAAQDPYAEVVGKPFSPQPYGLGINQKHVDFTQFVNGVLAQMRSDGAWQASYDKWLRPALGPPSLPAPQYGRQP